MGAIGFVVALPAEARSLARRSAPFESLIRLPEGHFMAVSGAGPERAHIAAQRLTHHDIHALVSWGCAAAIAAPLESGHLVLPERILGDRGDLHATDTLWRQQLAQVLPARIVHSAGTLIESACVVATGAEKQALHAQTGGLALDMESAAIARVARHHKLPFMAIRAIADPVDFDFPDAVSRSLNPRGDVRMAQLLGHLALHPHQIGELLALGRAFNAAIKTLNHVRAAAGRNFCLPDRPALTVARQP